MFVRDYTCHIWFIIHQQKISKPHLLRNDDRPNSKPVPSAGSRRHEDKPRQSIMDNAINGPTDRCSVQHCSVPP